MDKVTIATVRARFERAYEHQLKMVALNETANSALHRLHEAFNATLADLQKACEQCQSGKAALVQALDASIQKAWWECFNLPADKLTKQTAFTKFCEGYQPKLFSDLL